MNPVVTPPTALWGVSDPVATLSGGHRNAVFKTTGSEQSFVLKSCRRSEEAVAWLLPVLEQAAASGFVVAEPLRSLKGSFVAEGWTCEPFIAGSAVTAHELPAVLEPLLDFHVRTRHLPQRPGFLSSGALATATTGGDVDLNAMPADLVTLCRAAWAQLDEAPETIVHGDLFAENVLRCPDGRFAIIDWDEARRDRASFDLVNVQTPDKATQRAHLAWEVACSWLIEPDYAHRMADRLAALP